MLSPEMRSTSENRWMLIQTRSNWAVLEDQTNHYQNMSQPHAAAPLSHTLLCCIVQSVLFIFPHLLFFGSPPFYRDVNLATGWNNVTKRQVEMIYPQAMVASIESQLQHLSDDDDSSSLSDREERRLTRPQATAPCSGPTDGGHSLERCGRRFAWAI